MKTERGIEYEVIQSGITQGKDGKNLSRIQLRLRRTWITGSRFVKRTYVGNGEKWCWTKKTGVAVESTLVTLLNAIGLRTALEMMPTCPED
jgi:hypothetical protein